MSLDSLLKPVKFVDEQILRQYSKCTKRWEDKGRNIYHITAPTGYASKFLIIVGLDSIVPGLGIAVEIPAYSGDFVLNTKGLFGLRKRKEMTPDTVTADNPIDMLCEKINRAVRLPTFLAATGFLGKAAYDLCNYMINNEPLDTNEFSTNLSVGMGFLGLASSIYLKDGNPKLLETELFWTKASNWVNEKVSSLAPQPTSGPVPDQAYSTLENYV